MTISGACCARCQWRLAQMLLSRGDTVVIEWGTWGSDEREALRDGARALGAAVELVWLEVAVDEVWHRVAAREQEDPPASRADVEPWVTSFRPPTSRNLCPTTR